MSGIKIDDIRRQLEDISLKSKLNAPEEQPTKSFANVLQDAVKGVNQGQLDGEKAITDYVSGKDTNLHNTLLSLEKADVSFKLMMQVRGKLMEAYQQIMRTSV
ncbi:MAG: flagellar hook-basal body complex protein FliE [bacterium]|nr:flagellar hook-basal body complex protein FliE [bacterium]